MQTYFCSMLVKYKLISLKIDRHVLQQTFNKTMQKLPTLSKMLALKFGNLGWQIELSTQYILQNNWIATNRTGSNGLNNHQACSSLHHLYITCSKCPPPAHSKILARSQMSTNWDDASRTSEQSESRCSLNVRLTLRHRLRACGRDGADISNIM